MHVYEKFRTTPIIAFLFAITAFASSQAQVQSRIGVRAEGMGGAFLAVSNDVDALNYSPAGLINSMKNRQVGLAHHLLFNNLAAGEINLTNVSFFYNNFDSIKIKNKVIPVVTLKTSDLVLRTRSDLIPDSSRLDLKRTRFSLGAQYAGLYFPGQRQHSVLFSAATGFFLHKNESDAFDPIASSKLVPSKISIGVSARYIYFDYTDAYLRDPRHVNNDQELNAINDFLDSHDVNTGTLALDISAAGYYSHKLQFAVSVLNLVQPNIAARPNDGSGKPPEGKLARRYRFGAAYRLSQRLLGAVDLEHNSSGDGLIGSWNIYIGAEYEIFDRYFLRSGINGNWLSAGVGLNFGKAFTLNGVYQYNFRWAASLGDFFGGDIFEQAGNLRLALTYGN
jgi:hypothetical protein